MASQTRLISGGTTYYLAGGSAAQVPYAGSGTPWTAQTTTPYELSLNEDTGGIWTPGPAPTVPILGGGPPFKPGRALITKSYDNVTESVGIQLRATSHDNAVVLLKQLRQILNTSGFDSPCMLAVQPDGATNATYFEILYADVPESPSYLLEITPGAFMFRAVITWVRSIGSAGALTTLINAVTIENRSSGSPDNVESLGSLAGDLIYEGQPLSLKLVANAGINRMHMAVIYERVNTAVGSSKTTTTNEAYATINPVLTSARNRQLKVRVLARFDTFTNPSKIRLQAYIFGPSGPDAVFVSPLFSLPAGAVQSSVLLDFGVFDIAIMRSIFDSTLSPGIRLTIFSSDGTSVTANLDYVEVLLYYTFATIADANLASGRSLVVEQTNDYNVNSVVTPNAHARVYVITTSSGAWYSTGTWRGTLPRAYSGASLYLAWLDSGGTPNLSHTKTATLTTTALHEPLYHTLRGGA